MKHRPSFRKKDYPVAEIRRYLEPGPVVLVTSAWKGNTNIMTMGWHVVLEFSPSLVACCISNANHSFEMIRHSHECAINVPTTDLVNEVIGIGNCSGAEEALSALEHGAIVVVEESRFRIRRLPIGR